MNVVDTARRLVGRRSGHPVISLYLDLDPERFATGQARSSQVTSLLDEAAREIERDDSLSHDDRGSLREDLDHLRGYLHSSEPPFQGAGALAVFCSSRDDLFETVRLPQPTPGRVAVQTAPYIAPLIEAAEQRAWCVVLVNRRAVRVFTGPPDQLQERQTEEHDVHGEHQQGGWSQARYERSVEKDVDEHLRHAAEILHRRWRRQRVDRIVIGGPAETVPRFEAMLAEEIRAAVLPERVEVDVSSSSEDHVREAIAEVVQIDQQRRERQSLDRMAAGIGGGGRAVGGPEATVAALNERRVEALLLAPDYDGRAARCPACGILVLEDGGSCPADGTELESVEHLREAAIEAALTQDAEVTVVRHHPDLGPFQGIAALLRF